MTVQTNEQLPTAKNTALPQTLMSFFILPLPCPLRSLYKPNPQSSDLIAQEEFIVCIIMQLRNYECLSGQRSEKLVLIRVECLVSILCLSETQKDNLVVFFLFFFPIQEVQLNLGEVPPLTPESLHCGLFQPLDIFFFDRASSMQFFVLHIYS